MRTISHDMTRRAWLRGLLISSTGLLLHSRSHAGTLYRWVDAQGQVRFSDTPPATGQATRLTPSQAPAPEAPTGRATVSGPPAPPVTPDTPTVEAVLNRTLTVRLRVDPTAEVTVLPRTVMEALGKQGLGDAARYPVRVGERTVHGPLTSLRWLTVGTAEARDVNVVVDLDGTFPLGLLGQSFLRRFTMTVDDQGRVTFARLGSGR